jgi:protein PhnA
MDETPKCPKCDSEFTYADGALWVCPACTYEWSQAAAPVTPAGDEPSEAAQDESVRDAHGNVLVTGDSVTVLKDLKVKGSSSVVKAGTKVRGIRIVEGATDGHNISCKIDGIGAMNLKSEFCKKA